MSRALRDHVRQAYRISTKSQQADSVNIVTARVSTYGHFHKIIILREPDSLLMHVWGETAKGRDLEHQLHIS